MFVAAVVVVGGLIICNCIPILLNSGLYSYVWTSSAAASSEPAGRSRYASNQGPMWLSISNRCSSVSYIKRPRTWLAWDLIDPLHLIASYWAPPACLLAVRFCLLLHFAVKIALDSLIDGDITPAWLLAFKNWSAILVGCTGLLGCVVSLKYMATCAHNSASPRISLGGHSHLKRHQSDLCNIKTTTLPDGWEADPMAPDLVTEWGLAERLYLLSLSTAAPAAILVPALCWPKGSLGATEYALQSTAVALLLMDILLSRAPFVSYHLQVFMLFCSAYMATLWIDHAATGLWLFSRLDWSKASCIIFYMGLLLLVPVSWFTWYLMVCIRESVGGVCLQGKASAAFITTMTTTPEAKCALPQVAIREPSFALWTKDVDKDLVQVAAVTVDLDSDLTVQLSAPTNKSV